MAAHFALAFLHRGDAQAEELVSGESGVGRGNDDNERLHQSMRRS